MDHNDYLECNFESDALDYRVRYGGGRNEALARAAGFTKGRTPQVVDSTAGLGKDSFLLASLGAEVTLIERSLEMYKILSKGIKRAASNGGKTGDTVGRMKVIFGDSKSLLPQLEPEVVIVDPMHPTRHNSALSKLQIRHLRSIVGSDNDAPELMRIALSVARKRVVLKWPLRAQPPTGLPPPSHQIRGKTTRYDIFLKHD